MDSTPQDRKEELRRLEALCRKSLAEQGCRPDLLKQLAAILHETGRTEEAIATLNQARQLDPHSLEYPFTLGKLYAEQGNAKEAATCFEQAFALDPKHPVTCLNWADALMDAHEYDRAVATYRQALTLRTPFPEAHNNLAGALLHLGDPQGAIFECRQALAQRPAYAFALNTLGVALGKVGSIEEAIAALRQAISLRSHYANAWHNLGNVLDQAGRGAEARQAYLSALAINPTLEEARYNLAALGEMPPPARTPESYLMSLFNAYAQSFDQHLVNTLHYYVPQQLFDAVIAAKPPQEALDIIDLGCGTGLVGQLFRGLASRLTGIDVSARMLQYAERRNIYDQLVLGDYLPYLQGRQEPCDLVLAADVFIYSGELVEVFASVARLLRPGGLFAFSLETTTQADFVLQPNRRYAQSLSYIQRLARQSNLREVAVNSVNLRRHGEVDAKGLVLVLRRDDGTV